MAREDLLVGVEADKAAVVGEVDLLRHVGQLLVLGLRQHLATFVEVVFEEVAERDDSQDQGNRRYAKQWRK